MRMKLHDLCNDRSNFTNTHKTITKALYGGFFCVWHRWYAHAPKNGLKGASSAFGGHFLAQSANGLIQCVYFIHFIDSPCTFLPMPSH